MGRLTYNHIVFLIPSEVFWRTESLLKAISYFLKFSRTPGGSTLQRTKTIVTECKPLRIVPCRRDSKLAKGIPLKKHQKSSDFPLSNFRTGGKKEKNMQQHALKNLLSLFIYKQHLYSWSKINIFPCYSSLNFHFYSHDSLQVQKLLASIKSVHFFNISSNFLCNSPQPLAAAFPSLKAVC